MPFIRAADLEELRREAAMVERMRERIRAADRMLSAFFQTPECACPGGCGWRVRVSNTRPNPMEYVMPAPPSGNFLWRKSPEESS